MSNMSFVVVLLILATMLIRDINNHSRSLEEDYEELCQHYKQLEERLKDAETVIYKDVEESSFPGHLPHLRLIADEYKLKYLERIK